MKRLTLVVLALFVAATADAAVRTPERTALSSARKRGYTPAQTACFVPLFAQYAHLNRNGRWVAGARNRSGDAYRHEVLTRCGVAR